MKKFFKFAVFIGGLSLLLAGCTFPSFSQANSGIFVETNPLAIVFIDNQQVGTSPYENKRLKPGEITLRLVPQKTAEATDATLASWEGKVRLTPGVETIIRRTLAESLAASSGVMLTFDKLGGKSTGLTVVSTPDAAAVKVDGQSQGFTPVAMESIARGDQKILLTAPGYQEKLVTAKVISGHRLVVSAQLAQLAQPPASASPAATPITSPTEPAPKATTASPTPKAAPRASLPPRPYILIKDTPTGFLRVRDGAAKSSQEIARVSPGEAFAYITHKDANNDGIWYQIEYQPGKLGWISAQYAQKVE